MSNTLVDPSGKPLVLATNNKHPDERSEASLLSGSSSSNSNSNSPTTNNTNNSQAPKEEKGFYSAANLTSAPTIKRNGVELTFAPIQQRRHNKSIYLGSAMIDPSVLNWFSSESQPLNDLLTRLLNAEVFQPAWRTATLDIPVSAVLSEEEKANVVSAFKDEIESYFKGGREKKITIDQLQSEALKLKLVAKASKAAIAEAKTPVEKESAEKKFATDKAAFELAFAKYQEAMAKLNEGLNESL